MMAIFVMRGHCAEAQSEEEIASVSVEETDSDEPLDPEKVEYAKGSICQYCSYCKVTNFVNEQKSCSNFMFVQKY